MEKGFLGDLDRKAWIDQKKGRNGEIVPKSVSIQCPSCGRTAVFALSYIANQNPMYVEAAAAPCPACKERIGFCHFFSVDTKATNPLEPLASVYFSEQGKVHRPKIFGDEVPEVLRKAFGAAVLAYNQQNYSGAMVMVRRSLEGIFKLRNSSSSKKKPLSELIREAAADSEMSESLLRLANAIKEGGNLAAHFDLEREVSVETAQYLLELTEYLIEYFFVLPTHISALENMLELKKPTHS